MEVSIRPDDFFHSIAIHLIFFYKQPDDKQLALDGKLLSNFQPFFTK